MLKVLTLCLTLVVAVALPALAADHPAKPARPPIYDTKADGAKQITGALAAAKRERKNVLLQFGANWCDWCHKLHNLFQSDKDIASFLKANYVVVLIDVDKVDGKEHNADINQRYGNPCRFGLPALVVLDADGKQLTTQDSGKLEEGDHHDPAKVIKFLKDWAPQKSGGKWALLGAPVSDPACRWRSCATRRVGDRRSSLRHRHSVDLHFLVRA